MAKEKYGFVYIWRDKKHNRYYIGCHWGHVDDGYVCSSNWMLQAYKIRPQDFHRRILATGIKTRKETFQKELYFFGMIKQHEVKTRYYNLHITNNLSWHQNEETVKSISERRKGKAIYKDLNGNIIGLLSTTDPRVLSGEYVGQKAGTRHSEESLENIRRGHDTRRTVTVYNSSTMGKTTILLTELGTHLSSGWALEMDDVWTNKSKSNQKAAVSLSNTGSIAYYYPDGTLYGRIKHDDPVIDEFGLKHIRSEKQKAQAINQQKMVASNRDIQERKSKLMSTTKWFHNPLTLENTRAAPGSEPIGWKIGKIKGEKSVSGTKFWNNGLENKRFKPHEMVPVGWVSGMKPRAQ